MRVLDDNIMVVVTPAPVGSPLETAAVVGDVVTVAEKIIIYMKSVETLWLFSIIYYDTKWHGKLSKAPFS